MVTYFLMQLASGAAFGVGIGVGYLLVKVAVDKITS